MICVIVPELFTIVRSPNRGDHCELKDKRSAASQKSGHSALCWPRTSRKRKPSTESGQNLRFCPKKSRFVTAEGVTGQKRAPERDNMQDTSTNSCQWREVTHIPSTGVPKTGRRVQYGLHTDHKRVLERTSMPIFLDSLLPLVFASREISTKRMPDRGLNPTTSINGGRCREAIHMASVGGQ